MREYWMNQLPNLKRDHNDRLERGGKKLVGDGQ